MVFTKQEFFRITKEYRDNKRGAVVIGELDENGVPIAGAVGGEFESLICIACIIKNFANKTNAPVDKVIEAITMMVHDAIKTQEEHTKEEANKIIEGMFNGKDK